MCNRIPKILVVDDEVGIRLTLAAILERQGYETAVAGSGEEAVQMASSFQPDCIVSDVVMGAMNGIEAAVEILRTLPNCKVLLLSGVAGYGGPVKNAKTNGFIFEILQKPVPPTELLARISQMLSDPTDHKHHAAA